VLQSTQPVTGELRIPLDVRIRNKFVKNRVYKPKIKKNFQLSRNKKYNPDEEFDAILKKILKEDIQ